MDRNYHGAPRIARLIESTHVLIRAEERHPAARTNLGDPARRLIPGGAVPGDGVTVRVRVIEYFADVEGQEVPEMFCLVTDLMDYEEYPAPELRRSTNGDGTGRRPRCGRPRRAAPAGPGTGPMLPLAPRPRPGGSRPGPQPPSR